MPIYEIADDSFREIPATSFQDAGILERQGLQRLLRENVEIISPDTLVIAEEFGEWDESSRRIDLLGLDKDARLVVIELKRTETGGHMELQALRYASMVSTMTFEQAVDVYGRYLNSIGQQVDDPAQAILEYLEWDEPAHEQFAQDVRVVLASAEFSKELTTAVLWLNERSLDIRCVRLKPYDYQGRVVVEVSQVVPLPEAADYQVRVWAKAQRERERERASRTWDDASFMAELERTGGPESVATARRILEWAEKSMDRIFWGHGEQKGSFVSIVEFTPRNAERYQILHVWSDNYVAIRMDSLIKKEALKDRRLLGELVERLNTIPGVDAPADLSRRPRFLLGRLANEESLVAFLAAMDFLASGIRRWYVENRPELSQEPI